MMNLIKQLGLKHVIAIPHMEHLVKQLIEVGVHLEKLLKLVILLSPKQTLRAFRIQHKLLLTLQICK